MLVYDPVSTRPDPARPGQSIRDLFPGNIIPQNRIDPIARNVVAYYPQPNTQGDPGSHLNNFFSNAKRIIDQNQLSGRVDHNVGDRYRTFFRVAGNNTNLTQPDYYGNVATLPDRVETLITPPPNRPHSADRLLLSTLNSCAASTVGIVVIWLKNPAVAGTPSISTSLL